MKIKKHLFAGLALLAPFALQSCIDNDYDLSDIDTTVRLKATDLVVPLNLDVLTLSQVLDIEDDGVIVEQTDPKTGERIYAIKKEGDFKSGEVKVRPFVVARPSIDPTHATLKLNSSALGQAPDAAGMLDAYIIIPEELEPATFSSKATDVDEAIHDIDSVEVTSTFTITFRFTDLGVSNDKIAFKNLVLQLPKGLSGTYTKGNKNYNIDKNGRLDLSDITFSPTSRGELSIVLDIDRINATYSNITFSRSAHTLTFEDKIEVLQGIIAINQSNVAALPPTIDFQLRPALDDIRVNSFYGTLAYDVEDFRVDPIDLSSIPGFLSQSGTKIRLENPQLYLSVNNPFNKYKVDFESGFALTAKRDGQATTYAPQELIEVKSTTPAADGNYPPYEIVMAPTRPETPYEGYAPAAYLPFPGLKNLLAETGDGMPVSIEIAAPDPKMKESKVENFRLGEDLGPVNGTYAFYAPLQLSDDSRIAYADTIDGWNDEDVDAITLSKVAVNFDATTDFPYNLELSIAPVTLDGREMPGVTSTTARLSAKAADEPVTLVIEGPITHLDGIRIKANIATGEAQTDALSPDMTLRLKNSKITLTGYYEKEF